MAGWLIAVVVAVVTHFVVVYLYNLYRMNLVKLHFILSSVFCGLNNYFCFAKLKLHKSFNVQRSCRCWGFENMANVLAIWLTATKIAAALFMSSKWSPMTLAENCRVSHKLCYK